MTSTDDSARGEVGEGRKLGTPDRYDEALAAWPDRLRTWRRYLRGILVVGAVLVVLGTAQQPRAATIGVTDRAAGQLTLISIEGRLEFGDEKRFLEKLAGVKKGVVVLASDGGNVYAAIEIGRAIRQRGLHTAVVDGRRCASACALAWLGGEVRLMANNARVGFHVAYWVEGGQAKESGRFNALAGAYLNSIGLSEGAILYIMSAPPEAMTWLTFADASANGIDVQQLDQSLATAFQPSTLPSLRVTPRPATAASATPSAVSGVGADLIEPHGGLAQPPAFFLRPISPIADSVRAKSVVPSSKASDPIRKRTETPVPFLWPAQ